MVADETAAAADEAGAAVEEEEEEEDAARVDELVGALLDAAGLPDAPAAAEDAPPAYL